VFRFLTRWFIRQPRYEFQIVTGSSFVNVDEAAREAQLRIGSLTPAGWEAISIGTGGRAAGGGGVASTGGGELGGPAIAVSNQAQVVDVTVLMRRRI
jgi:hypothetical protein